MKIIYYPMIDAALLKSCETAPVHFASGDEIHPFSILPNELFLLIFSHFDCKEMANASGACKAFYRISKTPIYWQRFFKKYFHRIVPLDPSAYSLSIDQQFKLVFKQTLEEKRPYINMERKIRKRLEQLRGPTGFDGEIDKAWKKFDEFQKHYDQMSPELRTYLQPQQLELSNEYVRSYSLYVKLAGAHYNGTNASIDSHSKLFNAINYRLFYEQKFNAQDKFLRLIKVVMEPQPKTVKVASPRNRRRIIRVFKSMPAKLKKWKERNISTDKS